MLLIDDDIKRLSTREKLFSEALPNYILIKASNGYAALDFINEELPSLIVTKDELPLMSGDELIKTVRNKDKYFAVSVFILAEDVSEATEEKYESLVVDGIYQNDIEHEKLIRIIKQNIK